MLGDNLQRELGLTTSRFTNQFEKSRKGSPSRGIHQPDEDAAIFVGSAKATARLLLMRQAELGHLEEGAVSWKTSMSKLP